MTPSESIPPRAPERAGTATGAPSIPSESEVVASRFIAGDRVRVRAWDPPGHVRTPWYCRGHIGIVERVCGAFANPEELAYGRSGLPAQPLYRVRFACTDLWSPYAGAPDDVVEIEIYERWLEAA